MGRLVSPSPLPLHPAPPKHASTTPNAAPAVAGRKSFAEALYRSLIRLAPEKRLQVQGVFRYFQRHNGMAYRQAQEIMVGTLGLDLVRRAWLEARAEMAAYIRILKGEDNEEEKEESAGIGGGGSSCRHAATSTNVRQRPAVLEQEDDDMTSKYRRVRPRLGPVGLLERQGPLLSSTSRPSRSPHQGEEEEAAKNTAAAATAAAAAHVMMCMDYLRQQQQQQVRAAEQRRAAAAATAAAAPATVVQQQSKEEDALLDEDTPHAYLCPISLSLLTDPVVASDTYTYQRSAITQWFAKCRQEGNVLRSPLTNAPISPTLLPSQTLKTLVEEWVEEKKKEKQKAAKVEVVAPQEVHIIEDETTA